MLALTPTLYGVPNDLLYIDNGLVGAGLDGWVTLIAFAAGALTFITVSLLTSCRPEEQVHLRHEDRFEVSVSA